MQSIWNFLLLSALSSFILSSAALAACGDYDPSLAIEYRKMYQEALKARDYQRLKQLKAQRANEDLWVRTDSECESSSQETSSNDGASDDGPRIQTITPLDPETIDFECSWYSLKCKGAEKMCKGWVEENNSDVGYEWLEQLPACPCQGSIATRNGELDDWAFSPGDATETVKFHPGALGGCYRSPAIDAGYKQASAQQCCYDASSKLITSGAGAGTPDLDAADGIAMELPDVPWIDIIEAESVTVTEQAEGGHFFEDVLPFMTCGADIYTQVRRPNNANSCPANHI